MGLEIDLQVEVFRALGNSSRLRVIKALARDDRSVTDLQRVTGVAMSNISRHAAQLKRVGIITDRRSGPSVVYHLQDPSVLETLKYATALAHRSASRRHSASKLPS